MQIGMAGPDRRAKSSPNLFPGRFLINPEKGKQRSFIRRASHPLQTYGGRVAVRPTAARAEGRTLVCLRNRSAAIM
jgi:hypothetical protein